MHSLFGIVQSILPKSYTDHHNTYDPNQLPVSRNFNQNTSVPMGSLIENMPFITPMQFVYIFNFFYFFF